MKFILGCLLLGLGVGIIGSSIKSNDGNLLISVVSFGLIILGLIMLIDERIKDYHKKTQGIILY